MRNLRVAKFGGTSMGSAEALWSAARILASDPLSRLAVVSATSGTTNQLLQLAEAEFQGDRKTGDALVNTICQRHMALAKETGVVVASFPELFRELEELQRAMRDAAASGQRHNARLVDHLLSLGERLASEVFAAVLRAEGRNSRTFDARRVIRTDSLFGRAEPDPRAIESLARQVLLPELEKQEVLVTQGFIGSASGGGTTTLGRGGSDYSAALFGEALQAERDRKSTRLNSSH